MKFKGKLRPLQKTIVEKFMKHIEKKGSGLLALHTGFGKTCLALNIIARIKKKTIIIVHKSFLMNQLGYGLRINIDFL